MSKICVKCGYVRQVTDTSPNYECPKCGVVYAKAEAAIAAKSNSNNTKANLNSRSEKSDLDIVVPSISNHRKILILLLSITVLAVGGYQAKVYIQKMRAENERIERLVGFDKLKGMEKRWLDGYKLASSTGRIALSGPVQNLQTIGRELKEIKVSKCLEPAQAQLIQVVDLTTDSFIEFMQKNELTASIKIDNAGKKIEDYKISRDRCQ